MALPEILTRKNTGRLIRAANKLTILGGEVLRTSKRVRKVLVLVRDATKLPGIPKRFTRYSNEALEWVDKAIRYNRDGLKYVSDARNFIASVQPIIAEWQRLKK